MFSCNNHFFMSVNMIFFISTRRTTGGTWSFDHSSNSKKKKTMKTTTIDSTLFTKQNPIFLFFHQQQQHKCLSTLWRGIVIPKIEMKRKLWQNFRMTSMQSSSGLPLLSLSNSIVMTSVIFLVIDICRFNLRQQNKRWIMKSIDRFIMDVLIDGGVTYCVKGCYKVY